MNENWQMLNSTELCLFNFYKYVCINFRMLSNVFEECMGNKKALVGLTLEELKAEVVKLSLPVFTAKQIVDWIYKKKVKSIDEMTNISLVNREILSSHFEVGLTPPIECCSSSDGTKKYLFKVNNHFIESVFIPEEDRATLCVSTQVGCKMNCLFCATGKQGFSAHLSAKDILNQIFSIPESERLTNVVYMGMGEPFDNIDSVLISLNVLTSDYGLGWSPKRVTVSSVGLLPGLKRFLTETKCHLAISLHNPIAEERRQIMPIQKAYPIDSIVQELKKYDFSGQRRVSFEYTMFKGVNDQQKHIQALIKLLSGLECRINLIRFHSVPEAGLEGSTMDKMEWFRDELNKRGITTTIRKSRGEDIFAACGLLSTKKKNEYENL